MFAIGDEEWPGISKLAEEAGEVLQVIGKLMGTRGQTKHWNVPDLKKALEDEIADLDAAIAFVKVHCKLGLRSGMRPEEWESLLKTEPRTKLTRIRPLKAQAEYQEKLKNGQKFRRPGEAGMNKLKHDFNSQVAYLLWKYT